MKKGIAISKMCVHLNNLYIFEFAYSEIQRDIGFQKAKFHIPFNHKNSSLKAKLMIHS